MIITKDSVVSMNYVLKNNLGEVLDESADEPLVYLHGHQNIVPGLEKELDGLKSGDKKSVSVTPEDGYGEHDEKLKFPLPIKEVGEDVPPVGALVELHNQNGQAFVARVIAVDEENLTLDANHPLAGETLNFEVEITEVRAALKEELEHGHAHGPGGHHHH